MAKANYSDEEVAEWRELFEGDLDTIFRLIVRQKEPLDVGSIRSVTPILRRWLVEGLLGKLCHGLECKALLPALDNEPVIKALPNAPEISCFVTGGIRFDGNPISGIYVSDKPYAGKPPIPIDQMNFELMKLGSFTKQKRVYFDGTYFSCEEILKFVANKLGGVHYDGEHNHRQKLMAAVTDAITFGGPPEKVERGTVGRTHLVVEPDSTEPLNALHVEIVATAASLLCVQLNGQRLIDFEVHRDLVSRISDLLGVKERRFRKSARLVERAR